jgi:F-type H+-transporting ATPase subunit b
MRNPGSGEKTGRKALLFAATVFVALFVLLPARAEEGSSVGTERATEVFKWINFAIVGGVIGWVFVKLLPAIFRKNAEEITSAITRASEAKNAADAQLREAEAKISNLHKEIAELKAYSERESAAEVDRLRAATRSDIGKIAVAVKAEIEAAERAARLELKALAARLAVDGAESLLAKQLTPKAQESLISNFVKSLERGAN